MADEDFIAYNDFPTAGTVSLTNGGDTGEFNYSGEEFRDAVLKLESYKESDPGYPSLFFLEVKVEDAIIFIPDDPRSNQGYSTEISVGLDLAQVEALRDALTDHLAKIKAYDAARRCRS